MPIRYLKPGVRDSEAIDALTPLAENLFYRLLVTVDDFGRYDARPAMIKSHCFPIKDGVTIRKCEELLAELMAAGLIALYSVDAKPFLQMLKWDNVPRAKESKFPACEDTCAQMYADAQHAHANAPLTETETETETETQTGTETVKQPRSRAAASTVSKPEGLSDSVWSDFLSIRKAKRAPLTQTALDGIDREAAKAGMTLADALAECCSRGWQGFKAEWVANRPNAQRQTIHDERKATLDALTGRSTSNGQPYTIDAEATRVA